MSHLRAVLLLTIFYLGLTANLELLNFIYGALIAIGVTLILRLESRSMNWRSAPRAIFAVVRYIIILVYDLGKSGFQVARIVLDPSLPIEPGIITIPCDCQTETGAALNAHAITLTPGEVVIEMGEDGALYTHCLDATRTAEYIEDAQELRQDLLEQIFP